MKPIYLSTFCVDFRYYGLLREMLRQMENLPVGIEFATSWNYPEFNDLLDAQPEKFRGYPVTLHAPFTESCCVPGSLEYARMEQEFHRAFEWYHQFGASSMVMHTHKRRIAPGQEAFFRQQSESVICRLAEQARSEDIRLTVENVGFSAKGSMLYDQEAFISLFDRLPGDVGALIDIGHAMVNSWDLLSVIQRLGTRIRGYHLHNNDGAADLHRPLFESGMRYDSKDMETLLREIGRCSPDADLILEYAPGSHITAELLRNDMIRVWELVEQGKRQR